MSAIGPAVGDQNWVLVDDTEDGIKWKDAPEEVEEKGALTENASSTFGGVDPASLPTGPRRNPFLEDQVVAAGSDEELDSADVERPWVVRDGDYVFSTEDTEDFHHVRKQFKTACLEVSQKIISAWPGSKPTLRFQGYRTIYQLRPQETAFGPFLLFSVNEVLPDLSGLNLSLKEFCKLSKHEPELGVPTEGSGLCVRVLDEKIQSKLQPILTALPKS